MNVKIFTVFHRAIDQRLLFDLFTSTEVDNLFTLYGVNREKADKRITLLDGTVHEVNNATANVMLEYQLPWHDPAIQSRGFMEASCYVHLYKNALHEPLDYIGVAQYDMRWTQPAVSILQKIKDSSTRQQNVCYGMSVGQIADRHGRMHLSAYPKLCNWDFMLQSYNRFFKTSFNLGMLVEKPFTLWQTYLLPNGQFADLAAWLATLCNELFPWGNQSPYPTHWGHMAGWVERAESIFVAARLADGQLVFEPLHLDHDETISQKLAISKDHYGSVPRPS